MMINGQRFITEKEVSSLFGVSIGWIRKQRHDGTMPYHKLYKKVLYNEKEVDEWLKQNLIAH